MAKHRSKLLLNSPPAQQAYLIIAVTGDVIFYCRTRAVRIEDSERRCISAGTQKQASAPGRVETRRRRRAVHKTSTYYMVFFVCGSCASVGEKQTLADLEKRGTMVYSEKGRSCSDVGLPGMEARARQAAAVAPRTRRRPPFHHACTDSLASPSSVCEIPKLGLPGR